ncbi:hypothetical protein MPL3365_250012 [Mesorhizobium plurifarium]|uniref:Uncharacterized protein n=1 Tax=Mesorhizobium plurifarium TaxID=69974 RepID=A0A090G5H0_MESPL|nr:hypothetical protein MPL3365_250012 [Mesorhizobium plurifarium]
MKSVDKSHFLEMKKYSEKIEKSKARCHYQANQRNGGLSWPGCALSTQRFSFSKRKASPMPSACRARRSIRSIRR